MPSVTTRPLKRVLVVDDEPDIRDIAAMALETVGGLTVKTCASGRAALAEINAFGPDLVLLDKMMPDMTGAEVLRALRADPATRAIPVVMLTAAVRASEMQQLREDGANDVFTKPFDPMTLPDKLLERYNEARASRAEEAVSTMAAKSADLRARFCERLTAEYDDLARLIDTLAPDNTPQAQSVSDLRNRAHRIAGTAGTLGLDKLARCAADVETALASQDWPAAYAAGCDLLPLIDDIDTHQ